MSGSCARREVVTRSMQPVSVSLLARSFTVKR